MRGAQRGLDRHGHSRKGPTTLQEHKGQRPGDGPGRQGESSNRPPEVPVAPIATKNGEPLKRRRANRNNFSNRLPPVVAALTVLRCAHAWSTARPSYVTTTASPSRH